MNTQQLGSRLLKHHNGGGSAVYAVGSHLSSGLTPPRGYIAAAINELNQGTATEQNLALLLERVRSDDILHVSYRFDKHDNIEAFFHDDAANYGNIVCYGPRYGYSDMPFSSYGFSEASMDYYYRTKPGTRYLQHMPLHAHLTQLLNNTEERPDAYPFPVYRHIVRVERDTREFKDIRWKRN